MSTSITIPQENIELQGLSPDGRIVPDELIEKTEIGASRQSVALAMKAIAFQRRQTFTNVCCIMYFIHLLILKLVSDGYVLHCWGIGDFNKHFNQQKPTFY